MIILLYFLFLGEEKLACDILEQLSHVERFDMVLLFMSAKDKNGKDSSLNRPGWRPFVEIMWDRGLRFPLPPSSGGGGGGGTLLYKLYTNIRRQTV